MNKQIVKTNTYHFNKNNLVEIVSNSNGKKIRETNTFTELMKDYGSYLSTSFLKNLTIFCKKGEIEITVPDISEDNWGGVFLITLTGISTPNLVNYIIGMSQADEISMTTETDLRLWWD